MSVKSTSKLFPPNSDVDSTIITFFSIPENINHVHSSNSTVKCTKCHGIMLQEERFCPICFPERFYGIKKETCFKKFKIPCPRKCLTKQVTLLLIGVDMDYSLFRTFISSIKEKIDPARLFSFVFVGKSPFLVKISHKKIDFSLLQSIEQLVIGCLPFTECIDVLERCSEYAFSTIAPSDCSQSSLPYILKTISKQATADGRINDVIYLFRGCLPCFTYVETNLKLHLMQFSNVSSVSAIDFSLKFRAHYHFFQSVTSASVQSFVESICVESIAGPMFSVLTSSGFVMKDFSGNIKKVTSTGQRSIIELPKFSNNMPPFGYIKPSSSYAQEKYFTAQFVFDFYGTYSLVINKVWIKADSIPNWTMSIRSSLYLGAVMQQLSEGYLKESFPQTHMPWTVSSKKMKLPKSCPFRQKVDMLTQFAQKVYSPLKTTPFFGVKLSIALHFYYGGVHVFKNLFDNMNCMRLSDSYIIFPPYILSLTQEPYKGGLNISQIVIDHEAYTQLIEYIVNFRAGMLNVEKTNC